MIPIKPDPRNVELHYKKLRQYLTHKGTYQSINNWLIRNGNYSLEQVVTATFDQFDVIIKTYQRFKLTSAIRQLIKVYGNFSKTGTGLRVRETKYCAGDFVDKLGIKVCPYCNRNYINNVSVGLQQDMRRTSQLDHYYSKSSYPYLAMSYYNLVPSCPSCNLLKHTKPISASPYDDTVDWDEELQFNYSYSSVDFLKNANAIKVHVKSTARVKKNIEVFGLENQYLLHNDVVQELLKKRMMYSDSKLEEILNDFDSLYDTKEEIIKVVFGTSDKMDFMHRRPLSRMTKDIISRFYKL